MKLFFRTIAALIVGVVSVIATPADALQCVPFAREASGISLRGDAWTWWTAAAGQYDRGNTPRLGAVVVFKKFAAMRHGHVAVVTRVINSRQVLVDHANWAPHRGRGRGQISKLVAVTDVSPRNDWTEVRVWNNTTRELGTRTYPTYGFIYPSEQAYYQQASAVMRSDSVSEAKRHLAPEDPLAAGHDQLVASPFSGNSAAARDEAGTPAASHAVQTADASRFAAMDASLSRAQRGAMPAKGNGADGVWDGDMAAAQQAGAGHY